MVKKTDKAVVFFTERLKGTLLAESHSSIRCYIKGLVRVGFLSYVGADSVIKDCDIGRFCSIAEGVTIGATEHPLNRLSTHLFAFDNYGPFGKSSEFFDWLRCSPYLISNSRTIIGNDVWIGKNVILKKGITLADGVIVGAGSVVTKDFPPYCIIGGVPAKIIKYRFEPEVIQLLINLKWWKYNISRKNIPNLDVCDVAGSIDLIGRMVDDGSLIELPVFYHKFLD